MEKVTLCSICLNTETDYAFNHFSVFKNDSCISHYHVSCLQTYITQVNEIYCLTCDQPLDVSLFNKVKLMKNNKKENKKEKVKEREPEPIVVKPRKSIFKSNSARELPAFKLDEVVEKPKGKKKNKEEKGEDKKIKKLLGELF